MKWFARLSIKWKLIVLLILIALIGSISTGGFLIFHDLKTFKANLIRNIEITTKVVGFNGRASMVFNDPEAGNRILSSLSIDPQIKRGFLINNQNQVFASYGEDSALPIGKASYEETLRNLDTHHLVITQPVSFKNKDLGKIVVIARLEKYEELLSNYLNLVILAFTSTALLSAILALMFQRVISKPILKLAATSNEVSQKNDYSIRAIPEKNEDEISFLYAAFNNMLSQIEKRNMELSQYRDHLESMVVNRTQELMDANRMLRKEIEERELAQENLKKRIEEKEVLLKEINHRSKNNMQILSSMMWLQADDLTNKECSKRFQDCAARITSMAMVHEKVFNSENVSQLCFLDYLNDLCRSLIDTMEGGQRHIEFQIHGDEISLDVDKAISCGLIAHELITNCLKHAFIDVKTGTIVVEFTRLKDNRFQLKVSDDGKGFNNPNQEKLKNRLGLELVKTIVEAKLKGEIKFNHNGKTEVLVQFPEN